MAYQTSARAYRPQSFSQLLGQEHLVKSLSHNLEHVNIGHAYLFSGPRGVGKTSTARIFAKSLNCETGPRTEPCQECSNCLEITQTQSPDVLEIDGASHRGIDQIRELRENVHYLPSKSRYKIFIIDEVHMLTDQAFNALLKTLEEPPPHVIFLFATTEAHKVKATIRSRCQHYKLKSITLPLLIEALEAIARDKSLTIDTDALELIAQLSEGSLRDGQNLLDQISTQNTQITRAIIEEVFGIVPTKYYVEYLEFLTKKDIKGLLKHIHSLAEQGINFEQYSIGLIESIRVILLTEHISEAECQKLGVSEEKISQFKKYTHRFAGRIPEFLHILMELTQRIRTSTQPRHIFETYTLRLLHFDEIQAPTEILKEIKKLQEQIEAQTDVTIEPISTPQSPPTEPIQNLKPSSPPENSKDLWAKILEHIKAQESQQDLYTILQEQAHSTLADGTLHIHLKKHTRPLLEDKTATLTKICHELLGDIKTEIHYDGHQDKSTSSFSKSIVSVERAAEIFEGKIIKKPLK